MIGKPVDKYEGEHTAGKGKKRRKEIKRREKCRYEHRRKAGARAYADYTRVGKGVFYDRLKQHAGNRRRRPAEHWLKWLKHVNRIPQKVL